MEIIADVEIGSAVSVDVLQHGRKAPVIRDFRWLSWAVEKDFFSPPYGGHFAFSAVEIKLIRFPILQDSAGTIEVKTPLDSRVVCRQAVVGKELVFSILHADVELSLGQVPQGVIAVVNDIQIQPTIALDIPQCHGSPCLLACEAPIMGSLLKEP